MFVAFEARHIQRWIGGGGRLLDIIGGSEILERLVALDGPLGAALRACGLPEHCVYLNAASRVQLETNNLEAAQLFVATWPFVVERLAPGLDYRLVMADSTEAVIDRLANAPMLEAREAFFGPLVARSPRTGLPAMRADSHTSKTLSGGRGDELMDEGLVARRRIGTEVSQGKTSRLGARLGIGGVTFARDADRLAEQAGGRGLAYIHADASGLGGVFAGFARTAGNLPGEANIARRVFSRLVDKLMLAATRGAIERIVAPASDEEYPVRPIVVGGDDLTILLPAGLGFDFGRTFCALFVEKSLCMREQFLEEPEVKPLNARAAFASAVPERIDLGCGIAFVGAHYPASRAIDLASGLCDWAKTEVGRSVTALAFQRFTGVSEEDHPMMWQRAIGRDSLSTTAGPFLLRKIRQDDPASRPASTDKGLAKSALFEAGSALSEFVAVNEFLEIFNAFTSSGIPKGARREMLDLAEEDSEEAARRFARIVEVARMDGDENVSLAIERLERALRTAGFVVHDGKQDRASFWKTVRRLEPGEDGQVVGAPLLITPLRDIHVLASVQSPVTGGGDA